MALRHGHVKYTDPPRRGSADGPMDVCLTANGIGIAANAAVTQALTSAGPNRSGSDARGRTAAVILPFPRRARAVRPRLLDVRIAASDGRAPIGRSRLLRLTEPDLAWLLEAAQRLERAP